MRVSHDASEEKPPRFGAQSERLFIFIVIRDDVLTFVADTSYSAGIVGVSSRPEDLDAVTNDGSG